MNLPETTANRLIPLFRELLDGDPWIDVSIMGVLRETDAALAAKNIGPFNSIWQLVQHMVLWRFALLNRMKGHQHPTPDHNFIFPVADTSAMAWNNLLNDLEKSQEALIEFIGSLDNEQLDQTLPGQSYSVFELLNGLLQHDAYHLGQMVLLKKWMSQG